MAEGSTVELRSDAVPTLRSTPAGWTTPVARPVLAADQIHLWWAVLPVAASEIVRLYDHLSPDERRRAERFHFVRDRSRFVSARGVLRAILALYLEIGPGEIEFQYTERGKPGL